MFLINSLRQRRHLFVYIQKISHLLFTAHMYDVKMNQWVRLIIHINFMTFLFYRRDVNSQPVAGLDIEEEDNTLKKTLQKKIWTSGGRQRAIFIPHYPI